MSVIEQSHVIRPIKVNNQSAPVKPVKPEINGSIPLNLDSLSLTSRPKNNSAIIFGSPVKLEPVQPSYVKNSSGNFTLDEKPFKFIGTNMYSLANENSQTTENMMKDAASEGFTVIRFWANKNDAAKLTEICDLANKYNLKLVPVLANHYSIPANENKDDLWYREGYKKDYLPHVEELVQAAKNRPEIMMWELINEPSTKKFANVYNFSKDVSQYINGLDKNHMVTIGTIGGVADKFGGPVSMVSTGNFKKLFSIPSLDAVSVHDYSYDARVLERLDIHARSTGNPDAAKKYNKLDKIFSFVPNKIDKFILDKFNTTVYNPFSLRGLWNSFNNKDVEIARELQKPVFWGEVGFKKDHGEDRKKILDLDIAKKLGAGVQGYTLWSFQAQGHSVDGHDYGFDSKDGFAPVVKKWNNISEL
jgi:endo-1,4-beta-mannosidase